MNDRRSTESGVLLFTIERADEAHVARLYSPPNAARRDWEFADESYVEALATVINSLAAEGWELREVVQVDPPIYIMA